MTNQKTNLTVDVAIDDAVYWAGRGAVSGALDRAVSWAIDDAVSRAVRDAADDAVYWAVSGGVVEDPPHPGLQDFLSEIGEA